MQRSAFIVSSTTPGTAHMPHAAQPTEKRQHAEVSCYSSMYESQPLPVAPGSAANSLWVTMLHLSASYRMQHSARLSMLKGKLIMFEYRPVPTAPVPVRSSWSVSDCHLAGRRNTTWIFIYIRGSGRCLQSAALSGPPGGERQ